MIAYKKRPAPIIGLAALLIVVIFAVFFLFHPDQQIDRIIEQKGYGITEQTAAEITLTFPKSALSDQMFSEDGESFDPHQVIAYQDETTIIYLTHVQYANEGNDQMYFTFDFAYDLPKDHGSCLLPYEVTGPNAVSTSGFSLRSKTLRDDTTAYENTVLVHSQGPDRQISFYVTTEALTKAEGTLSMDIFLNQLTYQAN